MRKINALQKICTSNFLLADTFLGNTMIEDKIPIDSASLIKAQEDDCSLKPCLLYTSDAADE